MFIYMFCSKFAFFGNWFHAHFRCNGTSKPSLTPKPSLTIALKILKTIEKPLTPMVGPSKNIQWRWCNSVKTIERPLKSMVAWKKTLTIPSLWKIDHRCGLSVSDNINVFPHHWPCCCFDYCMGAWQRASGKMNQLACEISGLHFVLSPKLVINF